jgi:hypothetical protein
MVPIEVDRDLVATLFGLASPGLTGRLVGLRDFGIESAPGDLARELATELVVALRVGGD